MKPVPVLVGVTLVTKPFISSISPKPFIGAAETGVNDMTGVAPPVTLPCWSSVMDWRMLKSIFRALTLPEVTVKAGSMGKVGGVVFAAKAILTGGLRLGSKMTISEADNVIAALS